MLSFARLRNSSVSLSFCIYLHRPPGWLTQRLRCPHTENGKSSMRACTCRYIHSQLNWWLLTLRLRSFNSFHNKCIWLRYNAYTHLELQSGKKRFKRLGSCLFTHSSIKNDKWKLIVRHQYPSSWWNPIYFWLLSWCEGGITFLLLQNIQIVASLQQIIIWADVCRPSQETHLKIHTLKKIESEKIESKGTQRKKNQWNINMKFDTSLNKQNDLYLWCYHKNITEQWKTCPPSYSVFYFVQKISTILFTNNLQDYGLWMSTTVFDMIRQAHNSVVCVSVLFIYVSHFVPGYILMDYLR